MPGVRLVPEPPLGARVTASATAAEISEQLHCPVARPAEVAGDVQLSTEVVAAACSSAGPTFVLGKSCSITRRDEALPL